MASVMIVIGHLLILNKKRCENLNHLQRNIIIKLIKNGVEQIGKLNKTARKVKQLQMKVNEKWLEKLNICNQIKKLNKINCLKKNTGGWIDG